jgi:hypothetical protein
MDRRICEYFPIRFFKAMPLFSCLRIISCITRVRTYTIRGHEGGFKERMTRMRIERRNGDRTKQR